MPNPSQFPLEKVSDEEIKALAVTLWSWGTVDGCNQLKCNGCDNDSCTGRRLKRLTGFFENYKDITAAYEPDISLGQKPALSSHGDLLRIIKILQSQPDLPRSELVPRAYAQVPGTPRASPGDQEQALNLAVRVMLMVNCSAQRQSLGLLEQGMARVEWSNETSFAQFVTDVFPPMDHPTINDENGEFSVDTKSALKARKLRKVAGLKFRPTDDLRSHLKLDLKTGVVEVFHHTAFVKEHLRLTKDAPRDISIADCLKRGALPRQLALEVLDSIQKILFPLSDAKSYSLLRSLTSTSSFDPDCLRFESASIRGPHEKDIQYLYFGSRLADLYEELENPKPRGWMERWLERKSRARHVMMATVVGVVIAIFLGLASLAVGGYQAWVGYQQWQHPISNRSP